MSKDCKLQCIRDRNIKRTTKTIIEHLEDIWKSLFSVEIEDILQKAINIFPKSCNKMPCRRISESEREKEIERSDIAAIYI